MKMLLVTIVALFSTTAMAASDAEVAKWADETLVAKAKKTIVREGEAKIISVYQSMQSEGQRKVPGKLYWDVTCNMWDGEKNVAVTCVNSLETVVNAIGEDGFGRYTQKSCYIGNSEKVCDLIKAEAGRINIVESHGFFGDVKCSTTDKVVDVSYTTTNDYDGNAQSSLKIAPCL